MVSRSIRIKMILIVLAMLVLFIPFLYPLSTCRIGKEQLHISIASTKWIVGPEGGILIMNMTIENGAACDANVMSLQFRMYRLIYPDNTTQDVDLAGTPDVIHTTIPAGGNIVTNYAFDQPFSVGPRAVMAKITIIFEDGSSLEVFDGRIETTTA